MNRLLWAIVDQRWLPRAWRVWAAMHLVMRRDRRALWLGYVVPTVLVAPIPLPRSHLN